MPLCDIHTYHRPRPLTSEFHHVVPQAWQKLWAPPGLDRRIWHPDTTPLCPTGHRGVHQIIVAIMRAYERTLGVDPGRRLDSAIGQAAQDFGRHNEFDQAVLAPRIWLHEYGGSLDFLVRVKQYGYGTVISPR